MRNSFLPPITLLLLVLLAASSLPAQQVTGVWKGKIDRRRVEVKIVQNGDSLTGTSYYGDGAASYRRYSIRGYFDPADNSVVWWDDQLIESKGGRGLLGGSNPLLSVADFNCPGDGKMFLEGKAGPREEEGGKGPVDLTKVENTSFPDEWDFVIDNYTVGTNDPYIIDSVALVSSTPRRVEPRQPVRREPVEEPRLPARQPGMVVIAAPPEPKPEPKVEPKPVPTRPLSIEEKYTTRRKEVALEIPLTGDSIELRFYDNAQVDGDSITLFLNDRMLFQHIRLTEKAYTIKLPVEEMSASNELTMVAENLGTIPPNTSYMVAIVGDKRYEAKLASTENSSAVIRLRKNE
ncbi:MAG TPA: hypothetical protein VGE66_19940 [Chitinophagaceae bacterium]